MVQRDRRNPKVAWVSSSNNGEHWYEVSRTSCTCPAFTHGRRMCKHMARRRPSQSRVPSKAQLVSGAPTRPTTKVSK
jgi:hypothetical protein